MWREASKPTTPIHKYRKCDFFLGRLQMHAPAGSWFWLDGLPVGDYSTVETGGRTIGHDDYMCIQRCWRNANILNNGNQEYHLKLVYIITRC